MCNYNALEITKELVGRQSTNPGVYEDEVASYIESLFLDLPKWASFEKVYVAPKRPCVKLELTGKNTLRELVFICHMDTVPIAQGWTKDPFSPVEEDGKLFGLGACDMKGGTAGALSAIKGYLDKNTQPPYTLKFIGTMDEEADMLGVEEVLRLGWVSEKSLVLDTEPTDAQVQTAHKSRFWFHYTMEGIAAHASKPHEGADAIIALSYAITYIKEHIDSLEPDSFLGHSTIAFGEIEGGIHPYQVPGRASCYIDMRVIPQYSLADIEDILTDAGTYAASKIPGVHCSFEVTGNRGAVAHYPESELLGLMKKSIEQSGYTFEAAAFPGYTDTAVIACATHNENCMSYGPGSLNQAHKPDEFVAIEDVERCAKVYAKLIDNFLAN